MQRETERLRQNILAQARQEQSVIDNAYGQMARDQMASWDRKRAIIQSASDYGTQVMHEMQANTARTNDTVANLRSEAIRGVNTYYAQPFGVGNDPRVVEADVQSDRILSSWLYQAERGQALGWRSTYGGAAFWLRKVANCSSNLSLLTSCPSVGWRQLGSMETSPGLLSPQCEDGPFPPTPSF